MIASAILFLEEHTPANIEDDIDYLISSANKCIEGVPGICYVICRRDALLSTEGSARSLSLDLLIMLESAKIVFLQRGAR